MLARTIGPLFARPQVVAKANGIPLWGSGVHALQGLWYWISFLALATFLRPLGRSFLKFVATRLRFVAARCFWALLVLVHLVSTPRALALPSRGQAA